MITLSQYQNKANNVHQLIHKSTCSCTLSTYNKLDVKFTSSITLNNSIKVKANEYMLGCPNCHPTHTRSNKDKATDRFVQVANKIHGDKGYMYKAGSSDFMCPVHGPQPIINCRDHLTNICPCTSCDSERLRTRYLSQANKSNKGLTNIYLISLKSKTTNESFFKVGLCFNSVKERFKDWYTYYDIDVLLFNTSTASVLYDLEQCIHKRITTKNLNYIPVHTSHLGGSSECFVSPDQECINNIKQYINNKSN